jgi:hypothetical protein
MKRVRWLQKFFDELQRDKTARTSSLFSFFFSVADKKLYEKQKKDITKAPGIKMLSEIKHFDGKANLKLSDHKLDLTKNIGRYVQNCQGLYTKLLLATEDTAKLMRLLSDSLSRNAAIYKELAVLHAQIEVG